MSATVKNIYWFESFGVVEQRSHRTNGTRRCVSKNSILFDCVSTVSAAKRRCRLRSTASIAETEILTPNLEDEVSVTSDDVW